MHRTRFVLLALVAAFIAALASAGAASAATSVIDARDDAPGSRWVPSSVTIPQGDTVRWEFDEAQAPHTVNSTSANWSLSSGTVNPGGPAVEHTFNEPGVYTFVCQIHPATMTGTVTVEGGGTGDPLDNVLVFSKTAGFRHDSIPNGIAAIQQLGQQNGFSVTATEDSAQFTDANLANFDVVVFLSTTGDILNDTQQGAFERYIKAGGGFVGIHAAADTEYGWDWYGQMIGAYFRNHPAGTPDASVDITDTDEPSTQGIPARWNRTDEWYNYQGPVAPAVNGSGSVADYSARLSNVHVLATVDESTYGEDDGNSADDDHPISWCGDYDGGRIWYTGMGHTQASFSEPNFLQHILGGLETASRNQAADCGADERQAPPAAGDFEKVTLDDDTQNPMELDVAPDGRVFYIERDGRVQIWSPTTEQTVTAGTIPVTQSQENGLLGIQLAPDFETSQWVYLFYSQLPDSPGTQVISRFKVNGNSLDMLSEQRILTFPHQTAECCHSSGSLYFDSDGNLLISTGDNTNPFASDGFTPIDERPGRTFWDAQRTSANTNDLNGKIMRIKPLDNPTGPPGPGNTYTIPAGNLFPQGTANTKPEIYGMGFRNPFRFTVDPETNWVLMADYGPDAGATDPNRGPQGSVEFNALERAGNYGWPYCIRQNVPYNDYDFATNTSGPKFNCDNPVNQSPNNTGLTNLPPAIPADAWEGYTETDTRFPALGTGGAPMGGPRYHYDPSNPSSTKFPAFYDDKWFIAEWNNGWIKTATLNGTGDVVDVDPFALGTGYLRPMDLDFGPDGSLYVIEWGSGFGGNNLDSGIYRIDYTAGDRRPIAHATATPDNGPTPLDVQFSSEGSNDPEGTPLTFAWDFDNDGTTDSTAANPTHTYANPGSYTVTLRVTDAGGLTAVDNVQVVAGNTRPVVTVEIPENGQFAAFGDKVPYKISVTDAQDGSTGSGISCSDVTLNVSLGHDEHAHELSQQTGCEGTVDTATTGGHGETANIFTVLEAVYTDKGAAGSVPLTGRSEAILPPKRKQAEFFTTTGRAANGTGTGDPGVLTEDTTDAGAGKNIGFIEDGDYVSYKPVSFKDIRALTFRVASGGAGGNIEVRLDSPTGTLVGSAAVANTGGWQTWTNVTMPLDSPPSGTHELFLVFRNATNTGGLFNLNWFEAIGKGAATTEAPQVSADAEPKTGAAPLEVHFTGTATDADAEPGDTLTYKWDFDVGSTTDDTSTEKDPTFTYQRAGTYNATFTATDADGGHSSATVQIVVTAGGSCPTNLRSDEFDGDALDTNRWDVIRPDNTRPPTVSGGNLNFPIDNGSLYQTGTSARNIVVQDLPTGAWEVTSKITVDPLTENYQQAGLRIYAGDDNWASVHMIFAGTGRDFEFIYENNGTPRNEAADKLGGIPADAPLTYYVRLASDGTDVRAYYSYDGTTFNQVGRPAPMSTLASPKIGPVALSDQAATYPVAHFDWIRFNPDEPIGGGGGGSFVDEFDGADLATGWDVVRRDQQLTVSGSKLNIPAQTGDIYGDRNDAKNLVMRTAPAGPWVATAKVNFQGTMQYHQAGMLVYGDDGNFTKLGRLTTNSAGSALAEKFEFIYENAGTPRNDAPDSTANLPAGFPADYWVRITSDGTNITGAYSTDGTSWTPVGRAAPLPAGAKIGMFAFSNDGTGNPVAAFDSFTLTGDNVGGGSAGPSRDDEFTGTALDKTRWNAIVRDTPAEYAVSGGNLTITTSPGDIYTGDTTPPPNNFILQSADHAGADWVMETKIDSAVNGGYGQGGLIAYVNGDNYVKLDPIADAGQTAINRVELRTEVNGTPTGPTGTADPPIAAGTGTVFYLRLTKAGNNYTGEVSRDGVAWTPAGTVANPMVSPSFGLFAFGPQADGQGDTVSFDYFTLDGKDPDEPCGCTGSGSGDEFDGGTLDKTRFNAIIREDATKYTVENGQLNVTTVNGDIYTNGDPTPTRNFFLQTADHAGADWTIETKVDAHELSEGYEQAGLMVRVDDDNYIKYDIISDAGTTILNRLELRSEIAGAIQQPQPADPPVPAGATTVTLRLTKTGNSYAAEYSFDGTTFSSVNIPVTNPMTEPSFGLFTLGVNSGGGTAHFDYLDVDGDRGGCEPPPPTNQTPQIQTAKADPTIGLAPLPVNFTAAATDPDAGDTVTYSWDFGDGSAASSEQNPSHTYAQPGDYTAKLTVSDDDGATATRNVQVTALEPDDADARFRVLVFSKTAGFRHSSIDDGHAAIEQLGADNNFQVDHTEDATAFRDGILSHYDAVVWLSTTGDVLNDTQQGAFERFVKAGHGYAGIHSAADTEYDWKWYGRLVGGYFLSHPSGTHPNGGRDGTVIVEDTTDHSTQGLPAPRWDRIDEWYNYKPVNFEETGNVDFSPRADVHVLASLDESTYDEADGSDGVDDDHPISWCHKYDGGRAWYTGMGHTDDSFTETPFLKHILGGIEVAAGTEGSDICNIAPTVDATADPKTGQAPLPVAFSANGSDAEGAALTYSWDFGDGGTSLRQNPDHTYGEPGSYTAKVTVKDPKGATGIATVEIVVSNPPGNVAPTVEAAGDPTAGKPPLAVQFSATGSDPDGDALTYAWDFGDGGSSLLQNPAHTYTQAGTYTAKVTVSDSKGGTASDTVQVTVGNRAPTVQLTATPTSGRAPLNVSFSATGSDLDGDALTYAYDFGDGSKSATGRTATHKYAKAGVYTAKVTVTDTGGATGTAEVQITVTKK